MSIYMTEDEQIAAIKAWWKRYNSVIIISVSVLMLTLSGLKLWSAHKEKIVQQASNTYELFVVAYSNHDNKAVRGYASQLIKEYGQTVYADAARLTLAKLYAEKTDYVKAGAQLSQVAERSKVSTLKQIAKIRLARIFVAQKLYDQALAQLSDMNDTTYLPVINELKGDIYVAQQQYSQAATMYQNALSEIQAKGLSNPFLEMKNNQLATRIQ